MRIAFISSEVVPFAKVGGLADVCGALPLELEEQGHDLVIIMPYYRCVGLQKEFCAGIRTAKLGKRIQVFFIEHKEFFDRAEIYGGASGDHPDNLARFSFFCHRSLELLKDLGIPTDIVHCHDWPTGLVPVLLKDKYCKEPFFARTRSVFTIHNLGYQGVFPREQFDKLCVDFKFFCDGQIEYGGKINLVKAGIIFADQVTTVSPQYAREITTEGFGCGLDKVIGLRKGGVTGILNGLDYSVWDPAIDPLIEPNFDHENLAAKNVHKVKLQKAFGLPAVVDVPIFGFVGRLCGQKGMALLEAAFADLLMRPVQMAFLGRGEEQYEKLLQHFVKKAPQRFGARIQRDEELAHLVYAGSDFFIMPSMYEPCGLTQMISLRYGSIPVVPFVGGFVDTIIDRSANGAVGNGIMMREYSVAAILGAIDRAVGLYGNKEAMHALVVRGMRDRWPWQKSAKKYVECYEEALKADVL